MAEPNPAALQVGEQLPVLEIPVSAKLIVGGAIASRDFQDVHHDKAAAQALGSPDIFMNILTSNGLVGRYATDWAGEGARLVSVAIKLGVPNFPGDTMVMTGEVIAVDADSGRTQIAVRGANSLGDHVTATVTVAVPGS